MLLPILARAREEARRGACANQIGQIGKGQIAYSNTGGDYWAFQHVSGYNNMWGGGNGGYNPNNMGTRGRRYENNFRQGSISLAILYPRWIDDIDVFGCPSTWDTPMIYEEPNNQGVVWKAFYSFGVYLDEYRSTGKFDRRPAGADHYQKLQTSYGYDDMADPQMMQPGSARMCDMRWRDKGNLTRSNHGDDGQNVLYWDGHVTFSDSNYASTDPEDNIFIEDIGVTAIGDNYTSFDMDSDAAIGRTHYDSALADYVESGTDPARP